MNPGDEVELLFPEVNWTGASGIHRSHFMEKTLPVSATQVTEVMTLLVHAKMPEQLFDLYNDMFEGSEWLLTAEEFKTLTLLDLYRHLKGEGDSFTEKKLKNPMTGNVFHRIALRGKFVGGIRYWTHNHYDNRTGVGWRFRWEKQDEEEETTRIKTRDLVEVATEEWETIAASLNIPEPTNVQTVDASEKVRLVDND